MATIGATSSKHLPEGVTPHWSLDDLAEAFGVSRRRIIQLEDRALEKLRKAIEQDPMLRDTLELAVSDDRPQWERVARRRGKRRRA